MLYRRNDGPTWWIDITPPGGRRIRRSTGTEDRKAAEEYEAKLKAELWRVARLGERERHSWPEAALRWMRETETKRSHQDDVNLLRWLDPHLGGLMLDQITPDWLERVADARRALGVRPATINRMMSLIRAILRRAERLCAWIDRAPAVRMAPVDPGRIRWLTRAEAEQLIAELPEHLAEMARFTLSTGLRRANVTGLTWEQVDLVRRVAWIHPDQAKAGRAIGVPLNTDAVLVLRRQLGRHPERVFAYQGQPIIQTSTAAWYKALRRAGISDFRWHDLRHTWASWHVQAGTPLHVLQELGGWHSHDLVLRYAHLAPEHLADHAARIEAGIRSVAQIRHKEKSGEP
jgi:integrase